MTRRPEPIRVVPVPRRHAYVSNIRSLDGSDGIVHVLADPSGPDAPSFPARRLHPDWIEANHRRFDVMHVHFGFDDRSPERLEAVCDVLRRHGKALVYTVHDLRNPNHVDPSVLDAQSEVLLRRAGELITLTQGAAAEVARRAGREPLVLPHPHVVPLERIADLREHRRRRGPVIVGLHLKSLRAGIAARQALDALERLKQRGMRFQVNVHDEVYEPGGRDHDCRLRRMLDRLARAGTIELNVHPYFGEEGFLEYLAGIDVSLLAYRFGTHSGWLEACRDVGTEVVVSERGFYAEQGPHVHPFAMSEAGEVDLDSLSDSLAAAARSARAGAREDVTAFRAMQRENLARAHRELYERVTSVTAGGPHRVSWVREGTGTTRLGLAVQGTE